MTKRLEVVNAVKAMIATALPVARVIGLDGEDAAPTRVDPGGTVIVRSGDPGEPEIDLSPVCYNYDHRIPIEVFAPTEALVDGLLADISAAVTADRTLGGLCQWLDATAPETDDVFEAGARPPRAANLILVASYATTNPC